MEKNQLQEEYEKFIKEEQEREANNELQRRKKRGRAALFTLMTCMFLIPTTLCCILFFRLLSVEKIVSTLYEELYGTHTQETLASDNGNISQSVNTISFNSISADTADEADDVIICDPDPYEGLIKVCLTFDDGPSENTDKILDILGDYGVKATFFVNEKEGYDEQYKRIVDEGHTIAMHSATHVYRDVYASLDAFASDLFEIQDFIYEKTGVLTTYYRFPGGSSNKVSATPMEDLMYYLDIKGISYYDWNVASMDAVPGGISTTDIVSNVLGPIYAGEETEYVILMHDAADKDTTVEALPVIIETLADMENVVIVPISEDTTPVHHLEEE